MRTSIGMVVVLSWGAVVARADERAATDRLPPALVALGETQAVISVGEAQDLRGKAGFFPNFLQANSSGSGFFPNFLVATDVGGFFPNFLQANASGSGFFPNFLAPKVSGSGFTPTFLLPRDSGAGFTPNFLQPK